MNVLGIILGGGTGSRLKPLTSNRSKPAVPLAGKYRLVDVPISNCINSQIYQIYLLTQYNSASLHRHVQATYQFDQFSQGFVNILAAEQTMYSGEWFQGTADAVRQTMHHFVNSHPEYVIILSGDQLFRMDFRKVIRQHIYNAADLTICTTPVSREEAGGLGILHCRTDGVIDRFVEKPSAEELTKDLAEPGDSELFSASMGIYVFTFGALRELLANEADLDFGRDIIPKALNTHRVCGFTFDGYWKDIGTIRSFWKCNLDLCKEKPEFNFHVSENPIFTRPRFLPPARVFDSTLVGVVIADGVTVNRAIIENSVIGLRAKIGEGTSIRNTVVMGSDFYEDLVPTGEAGLGIGRNCKIENAIIDKNVRIGDNVVISPEGLDDVETELYSVRDGIIVIPGRVELPNGWKAGVA